MGTLLWPSRPAGTYQSHHEAPLQSVDKTVLMWKQRSLRLRRKGAGRYGVLDKVSMAIRQHTPPNNGSDNNHSLPLLLMPIKKPGVAWLEVLPWATQPVTISGPRQGLLWSSESLAGAKRTTSEELTHVTDIR